MRQSSLTESRERSSFLLTNDYVKNRIPKVSEEPLDQWLRKNRSDKYFVDIKWDGERDYLSTDPILLANKHKTIYGEGGNLPIPKYLEDAIKQAFWGNKVIVDTEFATLDDNLYTFLSERHGGDNLVLRVFDILQVGNVDLTGLPLSRRKQILHEMIKENQHVKEADYVIATNKQEIQDYFKDSVDKGFEGVVVKPYNSKYSSGAPIWLKIKKFSTLDLTLLGVKKSSAYKETGLPWSLLVGVSDEKKNGDYIPLGDVSSGLDMSQREWLNNLVNKYKLYEDNDYVYVRPFVVFEVEFQELTKDYNMRSPRIKRIRDDKSPLDTSMDQLLEVVRK